MSFRRKFRRPSKRRSRAARSVVAKVARNTRALSVLKKSKETKNSDEEITFTAVASSITMAGAEIDPTNDYFPSIDTGDSQVNRDGNHVQVVGVNFEGVLRLDDTTQLTAPTNVALYMVLDRNTNSAQMRSEDYLQPCANTENIASGFKSQLRKGRFRTIWQKKFTLTPAIAGLNASVQTQEVKRTISQYTKLNIPMQWIAGTSTVAAVANNSLHMICVATQAGVELAYRVRTYFHDN